MVTAVLLIAILNLGLGFALLLASESPWRLALPAWGRRPPAVVADCGPAEPPPTDAGEKFPPEWLAELAEAGVEPGTDVEAVLWLIQLQLPGRRASLMAVDRNWRTNDNSTFLDGQLTEESTTWLDALEAWSSVLARHKRDERYADLATRIEELLLDQHFQVKSARDTLLELAQTGTPKPADVSRQLANLFNSFDNVRDSIADELAGLLRDQRRLDLIDEDRSRDEASGAASRLGLERLFGEWYQDDDERIRTASCVLVDVDRTKRMNESLGPHATDRLLAAFGELVRDLVRKDRGFDRVVRLNGQSYLLFLGDTAVNNAASGADRVRQTIEVSAFNVGGQAAELTASIGVSEVRRAETLPDLLARTRKCVEAAKLAGRNRTFCDEKGSPELVTLPQYQVDRREIQVDTG